MALAFSNVLDITESEIISALQCLVDHSRRHGASTADDSNAMQVDSIPPDMPSIPIFLSSCVSYTTSPAALRQAIHQHLSKAEDLVCVLNIIEQWISQWSVEGEIFQPPMEKDSSSTKDMPPLAKASLYNDLFVLTFLFLSVGSFFSASHSGCIIPGSFAIFTFSRYYSKDIFDAGARGYLE